MTVATAQSRSQSNFSEGGYLQRPRPSGLADVVELILDKGLVLDAYVRVSLVGIEILTIDVRVVIASVDTYLKFAEATNRLDLYERGGKELPEMVSDLNEAGSRGKTGGAIEGVKNAVTGSRKNDDEDDEGEDQQPRRTRSRSSAGGHRHE